MTETKTTKTKTKKTEKTNRTVKCWCGCGGLRTKRFLPGHDARLKGVLQRAFRSGKLAAKQKALVADLGWERLVLTPDPAESGKDKE